MHRVSALLKGCLVVTCLVAAGCASRTVATAPSGMGFAPASVDAGPPPCDALHARIHTSEAQYVSKAGTWLDAPNRMVESRRLRALQARAERLGCSLPQV